MSDTRYEITEGEAEIRIYDIGGRLVKNFTLSSIIGHQSSVKWDGRGDQDRTLGSGVYFVTLRTTEHELTEKVVLLR